MSTVERRFAGELRATSQGDEPALMGYAAKFMKLSDDLGGFRERIRPGAFVDSIREGADVKFLMNHDPSLVMGRTKSGTLKVEEDSVGLRFNVALPRTTAASDLHTLVKRGDISQCSFAFTVDGEDGQEWTDERDGNGDLYTCRTLKRVSLLDCSAVTYPAYPDTEVSGRQLFPNGEVPAEVRGALTRRGKPVPNLYGRTDAERRERLLEIFREIALDLR